MVVGEQSFPVSMPELSSEPAPLRPGFLRRPSPLLYGTVVALVGWVALGSTVGLAALFPSGVLARTVPLNRVVSVAHQHEVVSAGIDPQGLEVQVRLRNGLLWDTAVPSTYSATLTRTLISSGAEVSSSYPASAPLVAGVPAASSHHHNPSGHWWFLPAGLWALFLLGVVGALVRGRARVVATPIQSSLMARGQSPVALTPSTTASDTQGVPKPLAERPSTRFSDIAGADEAVGDLSEIVAYLRDPDRFSALGAKLPRGALVCGPPGTGKTLLARAVAGEADVAFFSAKASDFDNTYVGAGAGRVRELFQAARAAQPSIVFLDEIDSVGRKRNGGQGGSEERANTLNALLAEMDGFEAKDAQVVVLAATNLPDILDPALVRPGRLSRKVVMGLPDRAGRAAILAVHARGRPLHPLVDLRHLAGRTPGMSGAELAEVVNEACLEAVRRRREDVDAACFEAAVATVVMGRARTSAVISDEDRKITAWHEAGHTVVAMLAPGAQRPVAVSILPRGQAGGVTWMTGRDDQYLSVGGAKAQLAVALGGRAGEELLLGADFTSGAASDLEQATGLAVSMVASFGMTDLGLAVRDPRLPTGHDSEAVTKKVEELLGVARTQALDLLSANRALLEAIVMELLEHDTLGSEALAGLRARFVSEKA